MTAISSSTLNRTSSPFPFESAFPEPTGPIADMQAVPPELLSLIFSAIYNDTTKDTKSLLVRTSYELLNILLVCRRWNDSARQTPELWTTVYVTHEPDASARAQAHASRAGYLEIDLIVGSSSKVSSTENCEIAFKQLLREQAHRLRSITLPFSTPQISEALRTPLPNLISFTCIPLTVYDEELSYGSDYDPCDVNLDTPKLRTLVLHMHPASFVGDNWPSLQSLEALCCSGQEHWLWGLLGASQQTLESLILGDPEEPLEMRATSSLSMVIESTHRMAFPNLTLLNVTGLEDPGWDALRFADMSALTSLTLSLVNLPNPKRQENPLPTFERLQHLSITTSFLYDVDKLHYLLQSVPHITSLTLTDQLEDGDIDEDHIIDPLLLSTRMSTVGPLLCRDLEEISILGVSTPTTKLKELVELRLDKLRKVEVSGVLWAEESILDKADLFEWLTRRVELSGPGSGWETW